MHTIIYWLKLYNILRLDIFVIFPFSNSNISLTQANFESIKYYCTKHSCELSFRHSYLTIHLILLPLKPMFALLN